MRITIILVLLLVHGGLVANDAEKKATQSILTDLKERHWPALYANKDAAGLSAFLADDFVLIAGGEVSTKADEVAWLADPGDWSQPVDFRFEVIDVVMITDSAAIVFGRGTSTRVDEDGAPCRHHYVSSNTLRLVDNMWRAVSSHVSDAVCEPL